MINTLKVFLSLFVLLCLLKPQNVMAQDIQLSSKSQWGSIEFDGLKRTYLYYIPSMAKELNRNLPLVIVLHGGTGKPEGVEKLTFYRFDELADRDGVIVVYPAGVGGSWNDGRTVNNRAAKENIDDVGFISVLIQQFVRYSDVDPRKVYVTGISNGAIFATRLAGELSNKIAAAAPVAGSIPLDISTSYKPKFPVSMLFINGDEDPLVPFKGGYVHFFFSKRGKIVPVNEAVRDWALLDGCKGDPVDERLTLQDHTDPTWVEKETYPISDNGAEVLLYVIHGGGHTWPSGMKYAGEWIVGKVSRQLDATDVIWDF